MKLMIANSGGSQSVIYVGDTKRFVIAEFMLESILKLNSSERQFFLKNSYLHEDKLTFGQYFKKLMKKYNYSISEMMKVSHCSRSVIENYRDFNETGYSIEKVLSICAGMKLLPPESKHLINKSGVINLESNTKRSKIYKKLINDDWDKGIEYWNEELKKERIPLLYKE